MRSALTIPQRRAAIARGRGYTCAQAAQLVGVHEDVVQRWGSPTRGLPAFRDLAEQTELDNVEPNAVLSELLYSQDESIRLRAALALRQAPPPADGIPPTPVTPNTPARATLQIPEGLRHLLSPEAPAY